MAREIYVSVDVEADGPVPGLHSMLSLAAVAQTAGGGELAAFSKNLQPLADATAHPATSAWWRGHPHAYAEATRAPEDPRAVMAAFDAWVRALPGVPVLVAYPVAFDALFVRYYAQRFVGGSPFGHCALDIQSYAMGVRGTRFGQAKARHLPQALVPDDGGSGRHVALADARRQGRVFAALMRERAGRSGRHRTSGVCDSDA